MTQTKLNETITNAFNVNTNNLGKFINNFTVNRKKSIIEVICAYKNSLGRIFQQHSSRRKNINGMALAKNVTMHLSEN